MLLGPCPAILDLPGAPRGRPAGLADGRIATRGRPPSTCSPSRQSATFAAHRPRIPVERAASKSWNTPPLPRAPLRRSVRRFKTDNMARRAPSAARLSPQTPAQPTTIPGLPWTAADTTVVYYTTARRDMSAAPVGAFGSLAPTAVEDDPQEVAADFGFGTPHPERTLYDSEQQKGLRKRQKCASARWGCSRGGRSSRSSARENCPPAAPEACACCPRP